MNHVILHFVNLFFAGMLAGIETAVHYGLGAPLTDLSEQSQIQLRQVLVLKLRVLVPVFFVPKAAPPTDWRLRVESAERFHVLGVAVAVIAFVCFIAAMGTGLSVAK